MNGSMACEQAEWKFFTAGSGAGKSCVLASAQCRELPPSHRPSTAASALNSPQRLMRRVLAAGAGITGCWHRRGTPQRPQREHATKDEAHGISIRMMMGHCYLSAPLP